MAICPTLRATLNTHKRACKPYLATIAKSWHYGTGKTRIKPLKIVGGCSIEMARLYREARRGKIELTEAKGLVWILKTLSSLIADSDLEKRIEALENSSYE